VYALKQAIFEIMIIFDEIYIFLQWFDAFVSITCERVKILQKESISNLLCFRADTI